MGFGMANTFIPDADQQLNSFTAFHRLVVMLIFLALNMHHILMAAMKKSFAWIPAGTMIPRGEVGQLLISATGNIFEISMQLAAPVLISLLFTMAALGLVARAVPQMNVFTLSFPISFFVGLLVYVASIPFFPEWMQSTYVEEYENLFATLKGFSPF